MGLGHIVLAAADEHAALLTALGQCRDTSDVRQWLVPDYVFTYALGPVFSSALADVNCLGGIVCKVYANNKGEMPR